MFGNATWQRIYVVGVFSPIFLLPLSRTVSAQNCSTPVVNAVGDKITVTATLSTSDPNENGEGEPLIVSSTGGELNGLVSTYFEAQSFTYTAVQANETVLGTIPGADGDESCSLSITVNHPHFLTDAQKAFFSALAKGLNTAAAGSATLAQLCLSAVVTGPLCGLPALDIMAGSWLAAALADDIAADPSDPNFMEIVTPIVPVIPPIDPVVGVPQDVTDALNAVIAAQAEVVGFEQALYATLNKAEGAFEAGDAYWQQQQTEAAASFFDDLSSACNQQATRMSALDLALAKGGFDVTITPNDVLNFEIQVLASGLPPEDVSALQLFGADPALIAQITNLAIVQDINAVAGDLSHIVAPPSLLDVLKSAAPPIDVIANGCAGSQGVPVLAVTSSLMPDSEIQVQLGGAPSNASSALLAGVQPANLSRKACDLLFVPMVTLPFTTGAQGDFGFVSRWPLNVPPGLTVFAQAYVLDAGSGKGWASSNTVQIDTP